MDEKAPIPKLEEPKIKKEETKFKLDLNVLTPVLPDLDKKEQIDIKYPVIPPHAYIHIYWDPDENELVYEVQEPVLNDREKQVLKLIEEGVRELINISFISVQEKQEVLVYLEKNINVLLNEFGIKLDDDSFIKIMYYVYRDFVGFEKTESLMQDSFIEDIECNGSQSPIYIVHRKYHNLRTNVIFDDNDSLQDFVEKLAQRCGKYISFANPLLDAQLPDGSRVNATFTQDISAKGPTFTIRKFTKIPWSPIKLMEFRTVSPEILAYLWIAIEHESSILIVGGTGSGKTSFLNAVAFFIPPAARIVTIEDTRELQLQHQNWLPSVSRAGLGMANVLGEKYGEVSLFDLLKESFRQRPDYVIVGEIRGSIQGNEEIFIVDKGMTKRIPIKQLESMDLSGIQVPTIGKDLKIKLSKLHQFIKHKSRDNLVRIKTKSGREIITSLDHSLFTSYGCKIFPIETRDIKVGSQIIIPSKIPTSYNDIEYLDLVKLYPNLRLYEVQDIVKRCISQISQEELNKLLNCVAARHYCRKSVVTNIPIDKFKLLINKARYDFDWSDKGLKVVLGNGYPIPANIPINEDFCRLLGYYLSEGSFIKRSVVITNSDPIIISDIINISKKLFNITPRIQRVIGSNHVIISSVILKKLVEDLCGRTVDKRVPGLIYGLSKKKICAFLKGIFSGDGSFSNNEISFSSKEKKLVEDVSYLLLSLNIVSRILKSGENLYQLRFKRIEDSQKFLDQVGFVQKKPQTVRKGAGRSSVNGVRFNQWDLDAMKLPRKYRHLKRFKRCSKFYLEKISNEVALTGYVKDFSKGDFYLDEVKCIEKLNEREDFVYDISVPPSQNFIGGFGGVVLHNSEAFVLFQGMASVDGDEKIFIFVDDKLKKIPIKELEGKELSKIKAVAVDPETLEVKALPIKGFFKHPPREILYKIKTEDGNEVMTTPDHSVFTYTDKVIPKEVSELKQGDIIATVNVKDKVSNSDLKGEKIIEIEKLVLKKPKFVYDISIPGYRNFVSSQGILLHNSGHPSFGTMHAESVETVVRRLETEPINLSPSLLNSLDILVIMTQAKYRQEAVRRLKEINEIIDVKEEKGKAEINTPFVWDPRSDKFYYKTANTLFEKISKKHGIPVEKLQVEFKRRSMLLFILLKNHIDDYVKVQEVIHEYYKAPEKVLARFKIQ